MDRYMVYMLIGFSVGLVVSLMIGTKIERDGDKKTYTTMGIIKTEKVGDIEVMTVCGIRVYQRVGGVKWVLGITLGSNSNG